MAIIKINEVEFEYNALDAAAVEKTETAMDKVIAEASEIKADKSLKLSQAIRAICGTVFECFNALFGEGTDKKVFGESCDMGKALDAFGQLTNQIKTANAGIEVESIVQKYMPNRQQRRAGKK
ncbi:DUF6673 family protein [Scatolibacter rhodanostii]|uniref:DUF6673 family protein n=1 Tax=Scatolibacter rhodanostii TaxID=2014781 RepID=UPI000C07075C|nr:DUF6673 family protein [Scatolibacter rhodanostii]